MLALFILILRDFIKIIKNDIKQQVLITLQKGVMKNIQKTRYVYITNMDIVTDINLNMKIFNLDVLLYAYESALSIAVKSSFINWSNLFTFIINLFL